MTIVYYYDSLEQAAKAFGCSRQWLSKLKANGRLEVEEIEGQQAQRVWHANVADALRPTGALKRHEDCVCSVEGYEEGLAVGRHEGEMQLKEARAEFHSARTELQEELDQVKAALDKSQRDVAVLRQEPEQQMAAKEPAQLCNLVSCRCECHENETMALSPYCSRESTCACGCHTEFFRIAIREVDDKLARAKHEGNSALYHELDVQRWLFSQGKLSEVKQPRPVVDSTSEPAKRSWLRSPFRR